MSAIYLYAWPAPNVFYAGVVLFHVGLGVLFCIGGLRLLPTAMRQPAIVKLATLVLIVGAALGLALIYTGASRPYTKLLLSHGAVSCAGGRTAGGMVVQPAQGIERAARGFRRSALSQSQSSSL